LQRLVKKVALGGVIEDVPLGDVSFDKLEKIFDEEEFEGVEVNFKPVHIFRVNMNLATLFNGNYEVGGDEGCTGAQVHSCTM
jgi:hypothetical protein